MAVRTGSAVNFLVGDHLGSTSVVTDASGAVAAEMKYKPFGEVRADSGMNQTGYTFTGQYSQVDDFGLMFYNARWVDPLLSHFASADTLIPGADNPLAWNRYAYALYNPIRYTDPSGHVFIESHGFSNEKILKLVNFSGQGWGIEEKKTFERVAQTVANAYARETNQNLLNQKHTGEIYGFRSANPVDLFLENHDGPVTFTRLTEPCNGNGGGCAAETMSKNLIVVYSNASQAYFLNHYRVIVHELGHAFNNAVHKEAQEVPSNLLRPMDENGVIKWEGKIFETDPYFGYAGGWDDWQFGYSGHPGSEEFADMFIGWVYGKWWDSQLGAARSQYMIMQMDYLLGQ